MTPWLKRTHIVMLAILGRCSLGLLVFSACASAPGDDAVPSGVLGVGERQVGALDQGRVIAAIVEE
jgi:hypothetical protein